MGRVVVVSVAGQGGGDQKVVRPVVVVAVLVEPLRSANSGCFLRPSRIDSAGCCKGESWPFPSLRLLCFRSRLHPAPHSARLRNLFVAAAPPCVESVVVNTFLRHLLLFAASVPLVPPTGWCCLLPRPAQARSESPPPAEARCPCCPAAPLS